ncbi:MAG: hypothetical protein ACI8XX_001738 [Polaribacter sp.]|jgi:hypothetical protein
MKKISLSILALSATLTTGVAFAYSCPNDMKAIDKAMVDSTLSVEDMGKVQLLRSKGEALHSSGDHGGSVQALNEAAELLGL